MARTVKELLRHSDVSTTMIYTHVLKLAAGGTTSPFDAMVAMTSRPPTLADYRPFAVEDSTA